MKPGSVFIVLLLFLVPVTLTAQWTLLNPMPTNEHLTALYFVDSLTGYLVGEHGTVVRTADGGATWVNRDTPISWTLNDVAFTSVLEGVVVGELGTILKTYDGGETWIDVGNYDPPLKSVEFVSSDIGYAAGLGGTVTKTLDGGSSWNAGPPAGGDVYAISFADEMTGYACGPGGFVARTVNGSASWDQLNTSVPQSLPLYCIDFPSVDVGYAGGGIAWPADGVMIKTTDGGNSWTQLPGFTNVCIPAMQFLTPTTGWVIHALFSSGSKTIDGGATWTGFTFSTGVFSNYMTDIFFANEEKGFACGTYGEVYASEDGGLTWSPKGSSLRSDLLDIAFTDEMTGFVAADHALFKSIDGGSTWDSVFPDTSGNYHITNLSFPTTDTGYLSTWNQLWRTCNSGENWIKLPAAYATTNMMDICFTSGLDGYICGYYGNVWITHDGGYSWESSPTNPTAKGRELFFLSTTTGYLLCNDGSYYKSSDAGETWTRFVPSLSGAWQSICFTDELHGYLGGSGGVCSLIKTVDGGVSWTGSAPSGMDGIFDLKFFSPANGYVFAEGGIHHTTDGGNTWIQEVQLDQITYQKAAIIAENIFAVGNAGTIMKRADSIATGLHNALGPVHELLFDCFPNPMTDHLQITCMLPHVSCVSLAMHSVQGLFVRSIDLGEQPAGNFSFDLTIPDLKPGLYLVRIMAGDQTATKKVIRSHLPCP